MPFNALTFLYIYIWARTRRRLQSQAMLNPVSTSPMNLSMTSPMNVQSSFIEQLNVVSSPSWSASSFPTNSSLSRSTAPATNPELGGASLLKLHQAGPSTLFDSNLQPSSFNPQPSSSDPQPSWSASGLPTTSITSRSTFPAGLGITMLLKHHQAGSSTMLASSLRPSLSGPQPSSVVDDIARLKAYFQSGSESENTASSNQPVPTVSIASGSSNMPTKNKGKRSRG